MHRRLRHRLGLTQQEVARQAGLPRSKVSWLENWRFARLRLPDVERSFFAMGATLSYRVDRHGAELDRLLDEGHALLAAAVVQALRSWGWQTEVEVSFSDFGDRGSIDILAWHPASRSLLVVEIKTEIGSLDGLLRPLDVKVRLAPQIARKRFGWQAVSASRMVVLPETSTARRTVARHDGVLAVSLPARSRRVRQWLAAPVGGSPIAGIWFLSSVPTVNAMRNPSSIQRVRRSRQSQP